ncbi:uncharacterized protein V1513DRAFT_451457, partial [Lipomyces chichibuensis]|uniref:uncharacterized protein n=1 Tax=Lipomyces chichibuensis TaxID=1546026 RepID=UPI003342E8B3
MPKVVLNVDNPVVSVGNPVSGTVQLRLEKPTALDDIRIQFKGVSLTRITPASNNYTAIESSMTNMYVSGKGRGKTEKHTHVNITVSLFQHPKGTELPAGEHVFPFIINVPEFSQCGCPVRIKEYKDSWNMIPWKCEPSLSPSGYSNILLPPSLKRSNFRQIDYKLVAIVDRPEFYNWNISKSAPITIISASLVHAKDPNWNIPTTSKSVSPVYTNSVKTRKLPKSYFVPGALPKASGAMKLVSLGTSIQFVDVPAVIEIELDRSNMFVFDKLCPRLYITVQVDDMSRISGILSLKLKSLIITMKARESGFSNGHSFVSEPAELLCRKTDISIPLEPLTNSGPARFRIDDKVIPDAIDISHCVPDFQIMSLKHIHEVHVEARISYNGGGTNLMEVSAPLVLQSGVDYDLDSHCILPPRYNPADYVVQPQLNDTGTEKDDFFD